MKHRPKHVAEYALVRFVCGFVSILPYRPALVVSAGLAGVAYALFGRRRAEALRRIRSVLGDGCTPRQARAIAWRSVRNMAFNAVEVIHISRRGPNALPMPLDFDETLTRVRSYIDEHPGRGGVFACPHMGNWELGGLVIPAAGIPMFTLTGRQSNPLVQDYLQRLRHSPDVELIPRGSGTLLRKVFAYLKQGRFLAIMPDLRSKQPGVLVRFLGGEANLYPGMGTFARQVGVPIFVTVMKRDGWTHHSIELHGPFEPDPSLPKEEDAARLSQIVMDILEAEIRADPGQWFWFNRRWILDPLEPEDDESESFRNDRSGDR